jgi:hypothetical protein
MGCRLMTGLKHLYLIQSSMASPVLHLTSLEFRQYLLLQESELSPPKPTGNSAASRTLSGACCGFISFPLK